MMNVSYVANSVTIDKKKIEMPGLVRQCLDVGDLLIIRVHPEDDKLKSSPRDELNRNVYAFDQSGKMVWRIQEAPHGGTKGAKPYTHVEMTNGQLIAGNWIGVDYQVNLANGLVEPFGEGKRPW